MKNLSEFSCTKKTVNHEETLFLVPCKSWGMSSFPSKHVTPQDKKGTSGLLHLSNRINGQHLILDDFKFKPHFDKVIKTAFYH